MSSKEMTSAKNRLIVMLVLEGIVLILCLTHIQHIYYTNIRPDKKIPETYKASTCTIVNKNLEEKKGFIWSRYRARFQVANKLKGAELNGVTFGNGLDDYFTTDKISQLQLLDQFKVGGTYSCWVNPLATQQIVLRLRHNWESIFSIFLPAILFLLIIYFFSQSLYQLLRLKDYRSK